MSYEAIGRKFARIAVLSIKAGAFGKNCPKGVDVIFANDNEAKALTGESSTEKAVRKLKEEVPVVALKKGKDGASVYAGENVAEAPAVDVPKADAVGAGDSFDAGFIYGFLSGMSLEDCAKAGCICGSLNTRAFGGTGGQPRLAEMMEYFRRQIL